MHPVKGEPSGAEKASLVCKVKKTKVFETHTYKALGSKCCSNIIEEHKIRFLVDFFFNGI